MKLLKGIAIAACALCAGCQRHIEPLATKQSPDGAIVAASAADAGDFVFEGQDYEVRLYPRGGRLADGQVVLAYSEENDYPTFLWSDPQTLRVQLPCGWWSSLTNHYQLPRTTRIISIVYEIPPARCPATMTTSSGVPKPGTPDR